MHNILSQANFTLVRRIQTKKFWIASFVAAQIFAAAVLWIGLPFSSRSHFSSRLIALSRTPFYRAANTQFSRPTLLVGVFITNATSRLRLSAFRRSFQLASSLVKFNLHHVFVLGDSIFADESQGDVLKLPIHENVDEGKTFRYFQAAMEWFSSKNVAYHPLNGIVKMDTDTAVDWSTFSDDVLPHLEPLYYLGRRNSRSICGNHQHCPPSICRDFSDGCWVYMSGGWYALSVELAKSAILNCSYSSSHTLGYEDLTVGTWISHCSSSAKVFHVENGDFFCHSSLILDDHISEMRFPKHYWMFFERVSCLGTNGKIK